MALRSCGWFGLGFELVGMEYSRMHNELINLSL